MSALRLVSCVLALVVAARAQTQLGTFALPGPFGEVGQEVAVAGDWDGDGVTDLIAAGPAVLAVSSGATGAELSAIPLSGPLALGLVGVPDIDGDGHPDVILANGADARALGTASGLILWSRAGSVGGSIGWTLALLDDQDGDGFPDVAIGEPDADPQGLSSAGSIHVLSGDSGATIFRIDGTAAQQQVGIGMDAGADWDGDGKRDLYVGDTDFQVAGVTVGRLRILRAIDGVQLKSIPNDLESFTFARIVAHAGDVTGDGVLDVGVQTSESGAAVEVFDAVSGAELWDDGNFCSSMVSVGDGDGDGIPAFVTGSPTFYFSASARVFQGLTGALIQTLSASGAATYADLVAPGDTNGNGKVELLASGGGADPFFPAPPFGLHQELPSTNVLHVLTHHAGGQALGAIVDAATDLDEDGTQDWLVASSARLVVFSGDDGTAILDALPDLQDEGSWFNASAGCTLGDVNGDGTADFAVANGLHSASLPSFAGDGRVQVLSGADGSVLAQRDGTALQADGFGMALAATTDHDGDALPDLYVGVPNKDVSGFAWAGEVLLVSGDTLETLLVLHGLPQMTGNFGTTLSTDADLTGDGVPEVAIGSSDEWPGQFNSGSLYILDGATHATLWRKDGGLNASTAQGALTGDLDGDDVADFVTAEPQYVVPGETSARGRVRAFSGASGAFLWQQTGPWTGASFGRACAGVGDANGDGYADVGATSSPQVAGANAGTFTILSGLGGGLLDQATIAGGSGNSLGAIASAGYQDPGGCADIILGVPAHLGEGAAYTFASSDGGVHGFVDVGAAKAGSGGSRPSLRGYGDLAPGGLVSLEARHALPFKSCTWFIGLVPGFIPFKQGVLVPSPLGALFPLPLATDATGAVTLSGANPASVFTGLALWHQVWFSDASAAGKVSASNGLQEIFK